MAGQWEVASEAPLEHGGSNEWEVSGEEPIFDNPDNFDARDIQARRASEPDQMARGEAGIPSSAIQAANKPTGWQRVKETGYGVGEMAKGAEAGVAGAGQIVTGLKMAHATAGAGAAMKQLEDFQAIDSGGRAMPSMGPGQIESIGQRYERASPDQRAQMRQDTIDQIAATKKMQTAAVSAWKEYQDWAQKNTGKVPNLTDVNGAQDFGNWLAYNSGQGSVYIVPMMIAALGGVGTLGLTSYAMGVGDLTQQRMDNQIGVPSQTMGGQAMERQLPRSRSETERVSADVDRSLGVSAALAVPYAAADVALGPAAGVATRAVERKLLKKGAETALGAGAKLGTKTAIKTAGIEVAKEMGEEAMGEGFQEFLGSVQDTILDDASLATEANMKRWLNAAAAGAAGAAIPSAAHAAVAVGRHGGAEPAKGKPSAAEQGKPDQQIGPASDWAEASKVMTPERQGEETAFVTPNGARITPELWDNASERVRQQWLTPQVGPNGEQVVPGDVSRSTMGEVPGGSENVQVREGAETSGPEDVPDLPRRVYAELEAVSPADVGATAQGQLQELRRRVQEEGQAPAQALRAVFGEGYADAPSELRSAIERAMDVQGVSPRSAPVGIDVTEFGGGVEKVEAAPAPRERHTSPLIDDLERSLGATTDTKVAAALQQQIAKERTRLSKVSQAEEYRRLAEETENPELADQFTRQADKLEGKKPQAKGERASAGIQVTEEAPEHVEAAAAPARAPVMTKAAQAERKRWMREHGLDEAMAGQAARVRRAMEINPKAMEAASRLPDAEFMKTAEEVLNAHPESNATAAGRRESDVQGRGDHAGVGVPTLESRAAARKPAKPTKAAAGIENTARSERGTGTAEARPNAEAGIQVRQPGAERVREAGAVEPGEQLDLAPEEMKRRRDNALKLTLQDMRSQMRARIQRRLDLIASKKYKYGKGDVVRGEKGAYVILHKDVVPDLRQKDRPRNERDMVPAYRVRSLDGTQTEFDMPEWGIKGGVDKTQLDLANAPADIREAVARSEQPDAPARMKKINDNIKKMFPKRNIEMAPSSLEQFESNTAKAQARIGEALIKAHGGQVVYFKHEGDKLFRGVSSTSDPNTIYIATNMGRPALAVMGHEFGHWIEKNHPDLYDDFLRNVLPSMKGIDAHFRELGKKYKGFGGDTLSQKRALDEMISDIWGDMWSDPKFHERLAETAPSFYRRFAEVAIKFINDMIAQIKRLGIKEPAREGVYRPLESDKFIEDVERVRDLVAQTMTKIKERVEGERKAQAAAAESMKSMFGERSEQLKIEPGVSHESREQDRISPRHATAVKRTEDPMTGKLQPDLESMARTPEMFEHNVDVLYKQSPDLKDPGGSAMQRARAAVDHFVRNLLWLHDNFDKVHADRSKLWYVGGNRIAHKFADRFGLEPKQAAAVIAALSPQKNWHENVSIAERVMSAVTEHPDDRWSKEMDAIMAERPWMRGLDQSDRDAIRGKTLRELWGNGSDEDLLHMAHWIRAWDEAHNPKMTRLATPEGDFGDWMRNYPKKGETLGVPTALRYGSFDPLMKALAIMADGSRENISRTIGDDHKVRSFYNNIIAPDSASGDVTMDTHAVAAAHMTPLGGSHPLVLQNFGGGEPGGLRTRSSSITGSSGNYPIYAEAYREAAAKRGVLPREMQSITWEAVRALFRPEQKKQLRGKIESLWNEVRDGKLSEAAARKQVVELAEGIAAPDWAASEQSDSRRDAGSRDSSYARELPEAGVPGGRTGPTAGRGGSEPAARGEVHAPPARSANVAEAERSEGRVAPGEQLSIAEPPGIKLSTGAAKELDFMLGNLQESYEGWDNVRIEKGRLIGLTEMQAEDLARAIRSDYGNYGLEDTSPALKRAMIALADKIEPKREAGGAVPPEDRIDLAIATPPNGLAQLEPERKWTRLWFDKFDRALQAEEAVGKVTGTGVADAESIRLAEKLFHGRAQLEGERFQEKFVEPLVDALKAAKKLQLKVSDADDYLMALHAPERNREMKAIDPRHRDGLSGMTDQQAQQIVAGFTPKQTSALQDIAKIAHGMAAQNMTRLVAAGLVTPQTANALAAKYKNYVPLKTIDEEHEAMGTGQGFALWKSDVKQAFGRQSKAGSPIANLIADSTRGIIRAEKANVEQSIWQFAQRPEAHDIMRPYDPDNPPPSVMKKVMDNNTGQWKYVVDTNKVNDQTIHLVIDGEDKRVLVNDETLKRALVRAGDYENMSQLLKGVGSATRVLGRTLTEWNPSFTFPNAVKDAIAAVVRARGIKGMSASRVLLGIPRAWASIVQEKRGQTQGAGASYQQFKELGGKTGAYGITGAAEILRELSRVGADLGYKEFEQGPVKKLLKKGHVILDALSAANEVLEYATRVSAFEEAKRAGYSAARATEIGKEITVNFNKAGELSRGLNALFVFFNAALQGLYGTIHFARSDGRVIQPNSIEGKRTRRAMYAMAGIGFLLQGLNEAAGGDDDDTGEKNINKISDYQLDHNATVLIPGTSSGAKIPLPPEYAFAYALGRRVYRAASQRNYGKEAAGIAGNLLDSTLPVRVPDTNEGGVGLQALKATTPTITLPLVELAANENFMGSNIVPEQRTPKAPQPWPTLSRPDTSDIAKGVADLLNRATGGDNIEPGLAQKVLGPLASAEGIQHVAGAYTGGLGQTVMQAKNVVRAAAGDQEAVDINKTPIVSRFAFTESKGYTGRRYRELASGDNGSEDTGFLYEKRRMAAGLPPKDEVMRSVLPEYEEAERQLLPLFKQLRTAEENRDSDSVKGLREQIAVAQKRVIAAYTSAKRAAQ